MQIKNIDHFVIVASDVAKTVNFYRDILGLEVVENNARFAINIGEYQKINIHSKIGEFTPFATAANYGTEDFCLIAEGNIESIKEEIEARGGKIEEGIVERNGRLGKMSSIYLRDPDGNLVEIAVY
ncbi:MAG: VOC family protein [Cardiobacteriaceae bacterium]|nr:VOC family protein [Cardiobacteriaceae bacterium]